MTRIARRLGLGVVVAVAAALLALVPTAAAQSTPASCPPSPCGYGPCGATITLDHATYHVGDPAVATLNGFIPNDTVTITISDTTTVLGTVTVDASGHGVFSFTVPNISLASHPLVATGANLSCGGSTKNTATTHFSVEAVSATNPTSPPPAQSSGPLAFTGANIWPFTLFGGLAILLGGLVVLASRKRAHQR